MNSASRTIRKYRIIGWAWFAVVGGYFLFEAQRYRGFYAWLAEKQIDLFGSYAPLLTFFCLMAALIVPVVVVLKLVSRFRDEKGVIQTVDERSLRRAQTTLATLQGASIVSFGMLLITVMFVVFGLPSAQGPVQDIIVSRTPSAQVSEGPTRLVGGETGVIVSFRQDWFFEERKRVYGNYKLAGNDTKSLTYFVDFGTVAKGEQWQAAQKTSWSGILVKGGLPGTIRSLLNDRGMELTSPYFTLYADRAALQTTYIVHLVQLILLTLSLAVASWAYHRQVKKLVQTGLTPRAPIV